MEKLDIRRIKSTLNAKGFYRTLSVAFVIMLIFFPFEGNFKYKYKVGSAWKYETLEVPFDFPILKSESELQQEKNVVSAELIPYYVVDNAAFETTLKEISSLNKNGIDGKCLNLIMSSIQEIYSQGIRPEDEEITQNVYVSSSGVAEQKNWKDLFTPQEAKDYIINTAIAAFPTIGADSSASAFFSQIQIHPNLKYDKATTDKLHRASLDGISPTKGIVYTGQFIIAKGEIVTENTAQILDSYKAEYQKNVGYTGSWWQLLLGHFIVILGLFLLVYVAIYFSEYQIFRRQNEFNFIIFILCFNFVLPMLVRKFAPEYIYAVPLGVTAIYLYAFIRNRVVLPIYFISLLPLLFIEENGVELYLLSAVSGAVAFITYSFQSRGWQQFLNGFYVFIAMALLHIGYNLSSTGSFAFDRPEIFLHLGVNALLVVLTYQLVTILEKLFRMVAETSYRDLADTDNRLLRELQQKAPGTFQHSLQVANMCERAVTAIGGNSKLVRAGALYHDVGKILNPQAFVENQAAGINYHEHLTPIESAQIIIKHVSDGMALAKKYKIPEEISSFILTHHAKSMTTYFYNTYCNQGGDPNNTEPFTYQGELPGKKEEVVLMMADAVEAASRSLKEYSDESISNLVESVLANRLTNSILERADISMREVASVKKIFKKMLGEIYHARIIYPKLNK